MTLTIERVAAMIRSPASPHHTVNRPKADRVRSLCECCGEWTRRWLRYASFSLCEPCFDKALTAAGLEPPIDWKSRAETAERERDEWKERAGFLWTAPDVDMWGKAAEEKGVHIREKINGLLRRAVRAEDHTARLEEALQAAQARVKALEEERELADVLVMTGCRDREDLEDMARVGRSLLDAIAAVTHDGSSYAGWTPADDPAEIVTDLINDLEAAQAEIARKDEVLREWKCVGCEGRGSSYYERESHMCRVCGGSGLNPKARAALQPQEGKA